MIPYEMMEMAATEVFSMLGSHLKLDREKAVEELTKSIHNAEYDEKKTVFDRLIAMLEDGSFSWESRHGALMGLVSLIPFLATGDEMLAPLKTMALTFLSDGEVRVRLAAGDVLGALCKHCGPFVYVDCSNTILEAIRSNLDRQAIEDDAATEQEEMEKLMEKFSPNTERRRLSAEDIFHDTAGWKSLETSMKALQAMVDGCGSGFLPFINQELLDLIFQSLNHTNRFVRETGFYVCSSLVTCGLQKSDDGTIEGLMDESNPLFEYGHQFSKFLGKGMSDNWSQVRLASSVATRKFLMAFPKEHSREAFFPELLPKMCLNRYYLADGVRLYSQETWKLISDNKGPLLVEKYIKDVVNFYVEQTQANNHAVREASCSCVAELAAKISREAVLPHLGRLLETLLVCFEDDSWPVRDAACLASGNFVLYFPEECKSSIDKLFPLFFMNLEDNIVSVRQGGAAALANVVKGYGEEVLSSVVAKVEAGLKAVENQPSESEKYGNLEKGPATFGVVKRLRDNDMELHTNQTMYSCGSLAPKMGRGRLGGCLDRTFRRPPQPWELTDGCIFLMTELAMVPVAASQIAALLPTLVDSCTKRHYTHHVSLLETMCKQLPVIARGVGKRYFKPHMELFFEPIFYSLTCENALTSTAASECLLELSKFFGTGIMRGRIEQYNPNLLGLFDGNVIAQSHF